MNHLRILQICRFKGRVLHHIANQKIEILLHTGHKVQNPLTACPSSQQHCRALCIQAIYSHSFTIAACQISNLILRFQCLEGTCLCAGNRHLRLHLAVRMESDDLAAIVSSKQNMKTILAGIRHLLLPPLIICAGKVLSSIPLVHGFCAHIGLQ